MPKLFRKRPIVVEAEQIKPGCWWVNDPHEGKHFCDVELFDKLYEAIPDDDSRPVRPSRISDT